MKEGQMILAFVPLAERSYIFLPREAQKRTALRVWQRLLLSNQKVRKKDWIMTTTQKRRQVLVLT